jgi:hypothetical protein
MTYAIPFPDAGHPMAWDGERAASIEGRESLNLCTFLQHVSSTIILQHTSVGDLLAFVKRVIPFLIFGWLFAKVG